LQYKFAFILKVPVSTDKASLIFGRVIHNTLYNFLLPTLSERQQAQGDLFSESSDVQKKKAQENLKNLLTEKHLLELYKEFWQNDGYQSKDERDKYKIKGQLALKKFFSDYVSSEAKIILYLEKKFSFRIGEDIIKGTIDRVDRLADGTLEIIDYKTGNPKKSLVFKDKRQLILYQLFLEEFLGEKVSALSYYYLESGEKVSFVASAKDMTQLKLGISKEIAAIKKRDFEPTPTPLCGFCDFRDICEFRQV